MFENRWGGFQTLAPKSGLTYKLCGHTQTYMYIYVAMFVFSYNL